MRTKAGAVSPSFLGTERQERAKTHGSRNGVWGGHSCPFALTVALFSATQKRWQQPVPLDERMDKRKVMYTPGRLKKEGNSDTCCLKCG